MSRTFCAAAAAALIAVPLGAKAQTVNCADLPNALWLEIGSTQEPLIKYLGKALRHSTANPMTLVYVTGTSCTNVPNFYNKVPIKATPHFIPDDTQVPGWDPSTASPTCTNTTNGHAIDVANSALFVETCALGTPPADVQQIAGPKQAYVAVVPTASSQTALTAEEAYFVFGFGNGSEVTPWDDQAHMFGLTLTASTTLTWANTIKVLPASTKWKEATPQGASAPGYSNSDGVRQAVVATDNPEKTIGILGAEVYDANRSSLRALAFQWFGQNHAYFPDSGAAAFDKKSLRDGHYVIWSPTVWLQHVDTTSGQALDTRTQYFINLILGVDQTPKFDSNPLDIVVGRGLVPDCAMQVQRSVEGGPLSFYAPAAPCGCYYDHQATGTTSCTACTDNSACGTGQCRQGFCEAR